MLFTYHTGYDICNSVMIWWRSSHPASIGYTAYWRPGFYKNIRIRFQVSIRGLAKGPACIWDPACITGFISIHGIRYIPCARDV